MLGTAVSHYRIVGKLGTGGMGVVYEAEDSRLPRQVALKFLSDELASDADAARRFAREAATIALLSHPNICTIFEIDTHEGRQFIAMEKLDGVNLKTYMSRQALATADVAHHRAADHRRSRRGAPERHRPPRHQAGQHHRQRRGPREGAGLRTGAALPPGRRHRGRGADGIDAAGPAARHGQLHGAGAHPADAARSAERSVLAGRGDVRDGDRPAAVCRGLARRHGHQRAGTRAAAAHVAVEPLEDAGEGGDEAAGQGRGRRFQSAAILRTALAPLAAPAPSRVGRAWRKLVGGEPYGLPTNLAPSRARTSRARRRRR